MQIKIKKLNEDAVLPNYAHEYDAGLDLYSTIDYSLEQNQRMAIPTGISIEIPNNYVGLIWGKSGLAKNNGLAILGGVIDSTYRGEIAVIALNTGYDDIIIKKGQKIAQILIQQVEKADIIEVKELEKTERNEKGFGSTGF